MDGPTSDAARARPFLLACISRIVAGVLLLLLSFVTPVFAQQNGIVEGRITDSRGRPVTLLVHLLADSESPAEDKYSDSNGHYAFMGIPSGTYYVVVEAEGYVPFRGHVFLDMQIQPKAVLNITLEPLRKTPTQSPPSVTNLSGKMDVQHPAKEYSPAVYKEYEKGNKARDKGNTAAALAHYRKALRLDPNFYPALNNMGVLLVRQRQDQEAEEAFLKAIAINPEDGEGYLNLGHVFYERGAYSAAIERLEIGVAKSPHSAMGNFLLGSSYFKLQQPERAKPLLKRAYELDPQGMGRAHLQLANVYLKEHNAQAARIELQEYLRVNPSDPQAPAIRDLLAKLGTPERVNGTP